MDAGTSLARKARIIHRHELRTLTYVTLDQANGGIVRNLTHDGIGVQAVAALRPQQKVRIRFELRYPRLRVETHGEVMWSTGSGQCGIRFLDLPPRVSRQLDEWIFGSLLDGCVIHSERAGGIFSAEPVRSDDGLVLSGSRRKVIELPQRLASPDFEHDDLPRSNGNGRSVELDWLSQPLSGRSLIWTVNSLVVVAALLLFALVFLSVTREAPPWPLPMTMGAVAAVSLLYWGFFKMFGGPSLGERLARLAAEDSMEREPAHARFR